MQGCTRWNIQPQLRTILLTPLWQLIHTRSVIMRFLGMHMLRPSHIYRSLYKMQQMNCMCSIYVSPPMSSQECKFMFWHAVLNFPILISIIGAFFMSICAKLCYSVFWISQFQSFNICLLPFEFYIRFAFSIFRIWLFCVLSVSTQEFGLCEEQDSMRALIPTKTWPTTAM
jgi:hypothetical protein